MRIEGMLDIQDAEGRDMKDILSDSTNKAIIESIMTTAKSTSQLCTEIHIPTSTAYRRMQKLAEYKIIRKIGTINESGKREILYRSNSSVLKSLMESC